MSTLTDTERFLQAVFPDYAERAIFAHTVPGGMAHFRKVESLDGTRDCYWSIAAFPDDKSNERVLKRALEVRVLVIDDVGTKVDGNAVLLALGRPSAIVTTSQFNYQWTYRLATPVPVAAWPGFFLTVEGLVGRKLEGRDAVHLFRLPQGVNTKPGRGMFPVKLVEVNPGVALALATNLNSSVAIATGPGPSGPSGPRIEDIKKFMALIPNDLGVSREDWVRRAHQIKALAVDEAEGWEAFDEWSMKWPGYNEAETRRVWDSIHSVSISGLGLLADAEAADHGGFTKAMNAEAGAAFDDGVEPPDPPAGGGGGGGITHVDMVEEIIRAEHGELGWMSNGAGRWAAFDPVMARWVIEEHDALMRAAVRDAVHRARQVASEKDAKKMAEAKWRGALQGLMTRERRLMLPFEGFDADLDMFGVPGGVVRLGAGGAVEEPGRASQMVSKAMSVRPAAPGVRGTAWEKFLDDFTMGDPELRAWWQAFCGYCLTGHTHEHAVVFLYGPGGNGKSVFLDTLADVMGPYHARAGHSLFMASQGSKHMAAVADLVGARLVTSPDVPVGCAWDLGLIKPLTGGGTFKAQFMRENWFQFTPRFKLVLAGNEKPALGGVDASIRRRFWLVPAMYVPKVVNKQLVDVLRAERGAVLRWMMDGWAAYNIGGLPPCALIEKETSDYLDEADVFGKWKASLVKAPGDMTRHRMAELWNSWEAFRAAEGSWKASPVNISALSTKLREAGYSVDRDNKGAYVDQISITKPASSVF